MLHGPLHGLDLIVMAQGFLHIPIIMVKVGMVDPPILEGRYCL
jgi:hypothetical protein